MGITDVPEALADPEYKENSPETPENEDVLQPETYPESAPEPDTPETPPTEMSPYPEVAQLIENLRAPRRKIRPEYIMALVALLAAGLLAVMVVLARPYFASDEDPQTLQEYHQDNYEPLRVTERPEAEPGQTDPAETEPESTTIPPDPNPYDRYDFQYNRHNYLLLQNVESYAGVDVSAYQGEIDWQRVKNSGIDFAIIRLGYRGYESGKLVEDAYALKNLEGAKAAGLRVGAYFFSQALNIRETDEEIEFILELLDGFTLDMPIVLDWEIPAASARTVGMNKQTLTDIQLHFCGQMRRKGFQPMIYFNWHQSEHLYDLHALEEYPFWLALYQDRMEYPWKVEMWQYTASGKVPGIQGDVDLNVYMPY